MTVAEMIAQLEKFPPEAPVVIEGYMKESDDFNVMLNPELIEGTMNEVDGVRIVVWASRVTQTEPKD